MLKKIVSLILLIFILVPFIVSCKDGRIPPETTETKQNNETIDTETENETDAPAPQKYICAPVKIDGVAITEYTVIYAEGSKYGKMSAELFARELEEASGDVVDIAPDTTAKGKYEILIGTTNRWEAETISEYYAYKIKAIGSTLMFSGYDKYAVANAGLGLIDMFVAKNGEVSLDELNISYSVPNRAEYIEDISKLYMRWSVEWEPDPRMLDFEIKKKAFSSYTNRLLTDAHRADSDFYPENSIEAVISFYRMGGDVVELDIRATKDNVLVLMHDETLSRTTNADSLKGTTVNGIALPASVVLTDWTYEQLMQLNLKEGNGGSTAKITPFKIATLTEALKVCKNRMFIKPDKTDCWRIADVNGVLEGNPNIFLYDCMKEADNYDSIILGYGLEPLPAISLQKYIYDNTGVIAYLLLRDFSQSPQTIYGVLKVNAKPNSYAVQVNGQFVLNEEFYKTRYGDAYKYLKGKTMFAGWTIDNVTDNEYCWKKMYELGYRMIMTNNSLALVKYAATTCGYN